MKEAKNSILRQNSSNMRFNFSWDISKQKKRNLRIFGTDLLTNQKLNI